MGKYNQIPLEILVAAKQGFEQIRKFVINNDRLIEIAKDLDLQLDLISRGDNSQYFFNVQRQSREKGKIHFCQSIL